MVAVIGAAFLFLVSFASGAAAGPLDRPGLWVITAVCIPWGIVCLARGMSDPWFRDRKYSSPR